MARGPHPEDARLFAASAHPALREALRHLAWLLTRGYAMPSSLKLVGDRFQLDGRQRTALMRSVCSDQALCRRGERRAAPQQLAGEALLVDGYNVLTTLETGLAGGVVLVGRDGCHRDLAGVHGTWRRGAATTPALELAGATLARWGVAACTWYLDRSVSNSGRLSALIRELAGRHGWPWRAEVVDDPDPVLQRARECVATSDSAILDRCARWVELAGAALAGAGREVWLVDLRDA